MLTTRADPRLLAAAAEMQHVAGWMAYDIGQPGTGRQHLREAWKLCQRAGDAALGAEMFAGMSHQAAFFDDAETAVDLALAAGQAAAGINLPVLTAEINILEAHGHAMKDEKTDCLNALRQGERAFERTRGETPKWLAYFDSAYMAAKTAHVYRDLGVPTAAETYARRSLEMTDGYERGRLFNTALLASTLADQRRVEEACVEGGRAVAMIHQVRSVRATAYLSDLARRLAPFNTGDVRDLYQQMHDVGVATPRM
ncbi:XRE family transcriptional regulator [Prauserella oleivorans]